MNGWHLPTAVIYTRLFLFQYQNPAVFGEHLSQHLVCTSEDHVFDAADDVDDSAGFQFHEIAHLTSHIASVLDLALELIFGGLAKRLFPGSQMEFLGAGDHFDSLDPDAPEQTAKCNRCKLRHLNPCVRVLEGKNVHLKISPRD